MRPLDFDEFLGQSHVLGVNKPLRRLIEEDKIVSLVLFGPPGTGKTALAYIIARKTEAQFISLNAVTAGIKDIRNAVQSQNAKKTVLFVDEIHRFNRMQQDALLPYVETGNITLIGASTHNPFFSLVPALSSRSLIFQLFPLSEQDIQLLLQRAISDSRGFGEHAVSIEEDVLTFIARVTEGDARKALNVLELAQIVSYVKSENRYCITLSGVKEILQNKTLYYDENEHYDTISAFIKSMRGSDADATVYWLSKMLESGEDPLFIARRIVICASEDVGNADPNALVVAVSALSAVEKIGMPEGRIPLSQAAIYIATAPKSNASYLAIEKATEDVRNEPLEGVPDHLKDSHYAGAQRLGAGKGYVYPHGNNSSSQDQKYMKTNKSYYTPSSEGHERIIKSRLQKRRTSADV
jgi:putative ATPase